MHNDPMEDLVIMYNWYDRNDMVMSLVLSEDALAPELRNPRGSAIFGQSWLSRLLRRVK